MTDAPPLVDTFGPAGPVQVSWTDRDGLAHVVDGTRLGPVQLAGGRASASETVTAAALSFTVEASGPFAAGTRPRVGDKLDLALTPGALAYFGLPETTDPTLAGGCEVTDAALSFVVVDGAPVGVLSYVAVGRKAQTADQRIGDTPWPAEGATDRLQRISDLVTAAGGPGLDPALSDVDDRQLVARDVDSQPGQQLLDETAASVGGLVVELHDGTLAFHGWQHRRGRAPVAELSADEILSSASWSQTVEGLANDVVVLYGDPNADPRPAVQVVDQASVDEYGRHAAEVDTQLVDQADALDVAQLLLARHARPRWRIEQLPLDVLHSLPPADAGALVLAETSDPVDVVGMPSSAPPLPRVFVEGWQHSISRQGWQLVLVVTDAEQTSAPVRWVDVDGSTTWADVEPDLTWTDAATWGAGEPGHRWVDAPADLRWADVDPATTWAAWQTPAA